MSEFIPVIEKFDVTNKEVIITGDTNINLLKVNEKEVISEFFDCMTGLSFFPKISLPTRFSNRNGSLIDNFFCKLSQVTSEATSGIMIKKLI